MPLVVVLDEAANVCRWPELPNLYSHYGSRGIVLMTFLQSWSQGVDVWGRDGMRKLWSAATVKVYGGGVADADFLEDLSRLIGDYDEPHVHRSRTPAGRTTTHDDPAPAHPRRLRPRRAAEGPRDRARRRRPADARPRHCRGWPGRTPPRCGCRCASTTPRPPRSSAPRRRQPAGGGAGMTDWGDEPSPDRRARGGRAGRRSSSTGPSRSSCASSSRPMYRRALDGTQRTWCPEWWRHAEAPSRLEALWRAWEHLRLDPATGMSVWFRDHADHHMAGCSTAKARSNAARQPRATATASSNRYRCFEPPAGLFPGAALARQPRGRGELGGAHVAAQPAAQGAGQIPRDRHPIARHRGDRVRQRHRGAAQLERGQAEITVGAPTTPTLSATAVWITASARQASGS